MAKEVMNKINYRRFAQRCRGAQISTINVTRQEKQSQILLDYNAKAARGGQRINGSWVINKKDRTPEQMAELEEAFMALVRGDFAIRKSGFAKKAEATAEVTEATETKKS